ncbi:MAG TPA: threonine ammonia-lyase [Thermoplasmata archaeon]|nr:threonine ammonia-lyase [Thermoplasmata archaeon]
MSDPLPVRLEDVRAAAKRISGVVRRTPLIEASAIPGLPPTGVYLKLENLQRTGAFKLRGATNRILSLSAEEAARGVVAASAGNHAQGVAYAARHRGIPATIVMARGASPSKVIATRGLGAQVILHGNDFEEADEEALRLSRQEGLTYVHPFQDLEVIAGQGTVALEILEDLPTTRRIIAGVGGGGLLAGITVAAKEMKPEVEIVGVQPAGADTLRATLEQGRVVVGGRPNTFADGLATRHIGDRPFQIFEHYGIKAISVDDRAIARAVFLLLENAKMLTEGAGAVPLAAVLEHPERLENGPTVLVLSGGNLDPFLLDRILWIGLSAEGRLLRIRAPLRDRPGQLAELLNVAAGLAANVRHIVHDRESPDRPPGEVTVEVELEVRDATHATEVLHAYREKGWQVTRVAAGDP